MKLPKILPEIWTPYTNREGGAVPPQPPLPTSMAKSPGAPCLLLGTLEAPGHQLKVLRPLVVS